MQPQQVFGAQIEAFGKEVLEASGRSLDLLRSIEATIQYLERLRKKVAADADFANAVVAAINTKHSFVIDAKATEDALQVLKKAQDGVHSLYQEAIQKRGFAVADQDLHPDDGVVEAFTDAIAALADLQNAINNLRWAVGELLVDSENAKPQPYAVSDIDKFLADLKR